MSRPSMSQTLEELARVVAKRSTCSRLNVGAVIHDLRGVVLSTGYNGALPGMAHCQHECNCDPVTVCRSFCGSRKPCEVTLHAEANAILWAARRGVATEGQSLTVTHSPCFRCAQLIIQCGIQHVYWIEDFRDSAGMDLLKSAGVRTYG